MNTWVDSKRYEWALQWENVDDGHGGAAMAVLGPQPARTRQVGRLACHSSYC